MRIGCEVSIPLGCSIAFMSEERLDVIQRHPVYHEPARGGVAHDPRREATDARSLYCWVPDPVPEVPVVHRAALWSGEYQGVTRPSGHQRGHALEDVRGNGHDAVGLLGF